MPRLEGERSNTGLYVVLVLVALIVVVGALELLGTFNLIDGFGAA